MDLSCIHLPMIFSVSPQSSLVCGTGYTSAVSKKSMPPSMAVSMILELSFLSACWPNVMVPRPTTLTTIPLFPNLRFSMR